MNTKQSDRHFCVYIVGTNGVRARVCMQRYTSDATLADVVRNADRTLTRYVVLDQDMVQHHASHPDDSNGAYLPHGETK